MELIRQKADHEVLGIHGLTTFVLSTMARLCMPVRDEEVQGLQALTDPAQLLREIFRVLGLMKMDMLNFTIQSIRTRLQDHTIQFERKKFQELLDKLPNSLDRTREWPCKAAAEVSVSSSQPPPHPAVSGSPAMPSPGATSSSTAVPSLTSVLNQGYMNLLCWQPGQKEYPEAPELWPNVGCPVLAGCDDTPQARGETSLASASLEVFKARYEAALEDVSDQVLQEVSRTLARLRYPIFTTDKCTSLKGQIKSIADKGNAVQHATEQRIHSFLSLFISPGGQNSQKDFPKGLDPIQEELLEVGRRFGSTIHHNRRVFGPYYSGILKKLLLPNAEPDSDAGMDSF
ncbi:T-complex protein 11 homolog [Rissa tridactyla]|uniref:T-complex protein 11 homolog n=1 Tax=Rissa tridactyla TaxID=75485 RepID=UPI0023BAA7EA|nr:T-complex protein 11 homolog [Rissa tridactyla]